MLQSLSTVPCGFQCMSVHIINEQPVHVIPSSNLVLKARIEPGPQEEIALITWEREPETGLAPERVTLAKCPSKSKCSYKRPNVHVKVEQQEATLEIVGYSNSDSGIYAVTVTDQTGVKTTGHCIVRIYGKTRCKWSSLLVMSWIHIVDTAETTNQIMDESVDALLIDPGPILQWLLQQKTLFFKTVILSSRPWKDIH